MARSHALTSRRFCRGTGMLAFLAVCLGFLAAGASAAPAATLDRIRQTGKLMLGYQPDARPFSYVEGSAQPKGYSVTLCERVGAAIKSRLGLPQLSISWVPVGAKDRFTALEQGKVDLLCGADRVSLGDRAKISFSMPIYLGGVSAMLRANSSSSLRQVLSGQPPTGPFWRASPARILQDKTFSAVRGTSAEAWLSRRLGDFQLTAKIVPVESYQAGVRKVLDGGTDAFFGQRALLEQSAAGSGAPSDLVVLDRFFTFEMSALAMARNDDDFRLAVDQALAGFFRTGDFWRTYSEWFGEPDRTTYIFFTQSIASQ